MGLTIPSQKSKRKSLDDTMTRYRTLGTPNRGRKKRNHYDLPSKTVSSPDDNLRQEDGDRRHN